MKGVGGGGGGGVWVILTVQFVSVVSTICNIVAFKLRHDTLPTDTLKLTIQAN